MGEGGKVERKGERILRAGIIVYRKEEESLGGWREAGRRVKIDIEVEPKETYICIKFPLLSLQKRFSS